MRQPLLIDCEGTMLAACLHPADGDTGVLIVTGGVQTRCGAHRGFVELADGFANAGMPCLRFDRRGNGDSDGDDPGFRGSGPDISAAIMALRVAQPHLRRVVGWGLCDGAAALALHAAQFDDLAGLILVNPWILDSDHMPEIPPRAAVAARYVERLRNPREWVRLVRGRFNLRRALGGLIRIILPEPTTHLACDMAAKLAYFDGSIFLLLAERDATAQAFAASWRTPAFKQVRIRGNITERIIPGAEHTFARQVDADAMISACLDWLAELPEKSK